MELREARAAALVAARGDEDAADALPVSKRARRDKGEAEEKAASTSIQEEIVGAGEPAGRPEPPRLALRLAPLVVIDLEEDLDACADDAAGAVGREVTAPGPPGTAAGGLGRERAKLKGAEEAEEERGGKRVRKRDRERTARAPASSHGAPPEARRMLELEAAQAMQAAAARGSPTVDERGERLPSSLFCRGCQYFFQHKWWGLGFTVKLECTAEGARRERDRLLLSLHGPDGAAGELAHPQNEYAAERFYQELFASADPPKVGVHDLCPGTAPACGRLVGYLRLAGALGAGAELELWSSSPEPRPIPEASRSGSGSEGEGAEGWRRGPQPYWAVSPAGVDLLDLEWGGAPFRAALGCGTEPEVIMRCRDRALLAMHGVTAAQRLGLSFPFPEYVNEPFFRALFGSASRPRVGLLDPEPGSPAARRLLRAFLRSSGALPPLARPGAPAPPRREAAAAAAAAAPPPPPPPPAGASTSAAAPPTRGSGCDRGTAAAVAEAAPAAPGDEAAAAAAAPPPVASTSVAAAPARGNGRSRGTAIAAAAAAAPAAPGDEAAAAAAAPPPVASTSVAAAPTRGSGRGRSAASAAAAAAAAAAPAAPGDEAAAAAAAPRPSRRRRASTSTSTSTSDPDPEWPAPIQAPAIQIRARSAYPAGGPAAGRGGGGGGAGRGGGGSAVARARDRLALALFGPAAASQPGLSRPRNEYVGEFFYRELFVSGAAPRVGVHDPEPGTPAACRRLVRWLFASCDCFGPPRLAKYRWRAGAGADVEVDPAPAPAPAPASSARAWPDLTSSSSAPATARAPSTARLDLPPDVYALPPQGKGREPRLGVRITWGAADLTVLLKCGGAHRFALRRARDAVFIAALGPEQASRHGLCNPLEEYRGEPFFRALFGAAPAPVGPRPRSKAGAGAPAGRSLQRAPAPTKAKRGEVPSARAASYEGSAPPPLLPLHQGTPPPPHAYAPPPSASAAAARLQLQQQQLLQADLAIPAGFGGAASASAASAAAAAASVPSPWAPPPSQLPRAHAHMQRNPEAKAETEAEAGAGSDGAGRLLLLLNVRRLPQCGDGRARGFHFGGDLASLLLEASGHFGAHFVELWDRDFNRVGTAAEVAAAARASPVFYAIDASGR
eukprot:tig00000215_g18540.t1